MSDLDDEVAAHEALMLRTEMAAWKPEVPPRGPEGFEIFAAILLLAIAGIGLAILVFIRTL